MIKLKTIYDMPPWDWPREASGIFLDVLNDPNVDPADRLLAAEMAGNSVIVNDQLAKALLAVTVNNDETEKIRAKAVLSLGPVLEHGDIYGFDDLDDIVVTEKVINEIQTSLKRVYHDAAVPREVRRRTLESAIRAPQSWHQGAVRAAYQSDREDWQLTAVFCMRFTKGFDQQIIEALNSGNSDIYYEAVCAAGNWGIKEAWPDVAKLLSSAGDDKALLFAAIDTAAGIGLPEAIVPLEKLLDSVDDDIVDAAHEALAMLGEGHFVDEYEEDDW